MYTLKVSKEQARVISDALELYARLHTGQIDQLDSLFWYKTYDCLGRNDLDFLRKSFAMIKRCVFPELSENAYHSIRSDVMPEEAKIAYDVVQVINHKLSWDSLPGGGYSVYSQDPLQCSKEELPKIEGGK